MEGMAMPTQFQVIHPPAQTTMGGAHLHTPPSIFQHMMGQQNSQNQPGTWNQVPQLSPIYMPWNVSGLQQQQQQLVRFTGERPRVPPGQVFVSFAPMRKRKSTIPESRKWKQFISEDKMAAHFKNMNINSNGSTVPGPSTSADCNPQPSTSTDLDLDIDAEPIAGEEGKSLHPRLVISDELKRLKQEPLLPAALLSKLDRPSMALVLWEPPSRHLRMLSTRESSSIPAQSTNSSTEEEDNNNNRIDNNNEQIPDMNQSNFDVGRVELEPMDL